MKKTLSFLLVLCLVLTLLPVTARADEPQVTPGAQRIVVAADITSDTVWTAGNTYVIYQDKGGTGKSSQFVEVASGATLTIEARATVLMGHMDKGFGDGYSLADRLYVYGSIRIKGTETDPVTFSSYYPKYKSDKSFDYLSRYGGLILLPDDEGSLNADICWCNFIGGGYSMTIHSQQGVLTVLENNTITDQSATIRLDHCAFLDGAQQNANARDRGPGISLDFKDHPLTMTVKDCLFGTPDQQIGYALADHSNSGRREITFTGCQFKGCGSGGSGMACTYAAVDLNSSSTASRYLFESCEFVTLPAKPVPIWWPNSVANEDRGVIRGCAFDLTFENSPRDYYGYTNMGLAMSGIPIRRMSVTDNKVVAKNLVIEEGGTLSVNQDASLHLDTVSSIWLGDRASLALNGNAFLKRYEYSGYGATRWSLSLGEGATVSGLDLYGGIDESQLTTPLPARAASSPAEEYLYAGGDFWYDEFCAEPIPDTSTRDTWKGLRGEKFIRLSPYRIALPNGSYDVNFADSNGAIEYSLDNGAHWYVLSEKPGGKTATSTMGPVSTEFGSFNGQTISTVSMGASSCRLRITPVSGKKVVIDRQTVYRDSVVDLTLTAGRRVAIVEFVDAGDKLTLPITLSKTEIEVPKGLTAQLSYTYAGGGTIAAVASDNAATAEVNNEFHTVTVTGVNENISDGPTTITLRVTGSDDYAGETHFLVTVRARAEIRTKEDLLNYFNGNYAGYNYNATDAILMADIVLNEGVLTKIGTGAASGLDRWTPAGDSYAPYNRVFDGNGHTISGLYYDSTATAGGAYIGFFGWIGAYASVHDLHLRDSYINVDYSYIEGSSVNVGGICGRTAVYLQNCSFDGAINVKAGFASVGGLAGFGKAWKCCNLGDITVETTRGISCVGGVVGEGYTTQKCCNVGSVTAALANVHTENAVMMVGAVAQVDYQEDCYYLAGSCTEDPKTDATAKTEAEFEDGSVCRLLQFHCVDGDQCALCGAAKGVTGSHTVTGSVVSYTVTGVGIGSAKPALVIAAQYQGNKMTAVKMATVTLTAAKPNAEGSFAFAELQGATYKLFLLEPTGYAPMGA